jgi:hypothetical protein
MKDYLGGKGVSNLKGRTSRKLMIFKRVNRLRRKIEINTQRIRVQTLRSLEEIFKLAASLAKGEFQTQTVDSKTLEVTVKERQLWARVAAYTAQVMNTIAEHFDERELDVQLIELEKLVNEAKAKAKDRKTQEGTAGD